MANSIVLEDNAFGTLASGLAASDTTLTFTTGHGARFPAVASGQVLYCCLLNANNVLEEVRITAHTANADTATMTRGANGTTAKAWSAGDRIEARLSSEVLRHLQQEAFTSTTISTADAGATYTGSMGTTAVGYVSGMIYAFTAATANSTTTPTIAIDGLAAKTVIRDDGTALAAGEMPVNGQYKYDGTNFMLMKPVNVRNYALIREEQVQNTGGGTFTSGAWRTRTLNTEVTDTGADVSLSSNQMTLAAGTYEIAAYAPATQVGGHQARLYNVTDAAVVILGSSGHGNSAGDYAGNDHSVIVGRFTIAAGKALEIQHKCVTTCADVGFGYQANISTEIYTVVELRRVA